MIAAERWFFCEACASACVVCHTCGATSCIGGGCQRCEQELDEAFQLVVDGAAPPPEQLPRLQELWEERFALC